MAARRRRSNLVIRRGAEGRGDAVSRRTPGVLGLVTVLIGLGALVVSLVILGSVLRRRPAFDRPPVVPVDRTVRQEPVGRVEPLWPAGWDAMDEPQKIAALRKREQDLAERLAAEFPDDDDALVALGNVYRKFGDTARALPQWEKALVLNPKRADAYDAMASVAMEKGEHDRAVQLWQKAIAVDPDRRGLRSTMAQALSRAEKHDEAILALEEEVARYPVSATAQFLLGQERLLKKDYAGAKVCYEKAAAEDPNHVGAHYGLLTACARLGLKAEAEKYRLRFNRLKAEDMKKLKSRNEGFDDLGSTRQGIAETCLAAATVYAREGRGDLAEQFVRQAEEADPDNIQCLTRRAARLLTEGRLTEALDVHEHIRRLAPDDAVNLFNMGSACASLRQYERARTLYERVIILAPRWDAGCRELARLFLVTGRELPRALELARKAADLAPAAAENYFVRSWARDRNGDKAGALADLKKAVELEPDNPMYRQKYQLAETRR